MSHFATVVLVEGEVNRDSAEDVVTPLLAPYDEQGEWFAEGSRWDWWQIGGRWTGELTREKYDPAEDPENFETCSLCGGTGERPGGREQFGDAWYEACNGCNGCKGKGWRTKWPTEWKEHPGDVARVADVDPEFLPMAVVTPDGKWHEQARMGWFGMTREDEAGEGEKPEVLWASTVKALYEQHPEATAVLVDCHV